MVGAEDESEGVDEEEPWLVRHKVMVAYATLAGRSLRP
jgi:hypothetical protein